MILLDGIESTPRQRPVVVVVGGGAAGTLAALHLLEAGAPGKVVVVEPAHELGFGVAYRTRHPLHLLNVPAARMSAFPDRPDDFVSWLGGGKGDAFVSRRLFGEYLRARLANAGGPERLEHVRGEVIRLDLVGRGVRVSIDGDRAIQADRVLLAVGQPQEERPELGSPSIHAASAFVESPWKPGALDRVRRGDTVLLVGTGLSMVDIALELAERGALLTAVSRRGLLPRSHSSRPVAAVPLDLAAGGRLGELVRSVRIAGETSDHWTAAVDGLRPLTQSLWRDLTCEEQSRFLRHLAPHWNVHRHRMPPQTAAAIERLRLAGQLRVLAASIRRIDAGEAGLVAELAPRGSSSPELLPVDHVINCSGPRARLGDHPPELLRTLLEGGLGRLDALGVGVDTDADGALVDSSGRISERLFAIGALRRGTLLESTAIPELRQQARELAARVATGSGPPAPRPSPPAVRAGGSEVLR